ncbi:hypothetical protein ENBRE01_0502 [Enteropsectra breve]|nr:hypothetical protein ENBRE01_0502 [Enteropsectra breve]
MGEIRDKIKSKIDETSSEEQPVTKRARCEDSSISSDVETETLESASVTASDSADCCEIDPNNIEFSEDSEQNLGCSDFDKESSHASCAFDSQEQFSSECNTEEEKDFFGDEAVGLSESDSSEVAWEDSDTDEELREDYTASANWLNTEGLSKNIKKTTKKIKFKYTRKVFSAKCQIRILKIYGNLKLIIDTFNIVYLTTDFEHYKAFKIDMFHISDAIFLNGKVLLSNNNSNIIKELNYDGKIRDINKRIGLVKKMYMHNEKIYVLSEKIYVFDTRLNLKSSFSTQLVSLAFNGQTVAGMDSNGFLYAFDHMLRFKKKYSLGLRFQFKSIFSTGKNYIVSLDNGVVILDDNFNEVKTVNNISNEITGFACSEAFAFYSTSAPNSLRILKINLEFYDRFPFSKIKINGVQSMDIHESTLYMASSNYVSTLKIEYK